MSFPLYPEIYNIITSYLYNIQIIDDTIYRFKCSQCRKFYDQSILKETNEQSWNNAHRIYCPSCRKMFGLQWTYKSW